MRKLLLALPTAFLFALGMMGVSNPSNANPHKTICKQGTKRCVKGHVHVCAGGKKWQKTGKECKPKVGCAKLLLHCAAGSPVLATICGGKVHTLASNVSQNISYVAFGNAVKGAVLTRCGTGEKLTIRQSTNLCSLRGGCCDKKTRWNDTICKIRLF